jgi:hypothetical protein
VIFFESLRKFGRAILADAGLAKPNKSLSRLIHITEVL